MKQNKIVEVDETCGEPPAYLPHGSADGTVWPSDTRRLAAFIEGRVAR